LYGHTHDKFVDKPPRNSGGFFGGGQGLNWAVKPSKEERNEQEEEEEEEEVHVIRST
jgi:hypothetical protein